MLSKLWFGVIRFPTSVVHGVTVVFINQVVQKHCKYKAEIHRLEREKNKKIMIGEGQAWIYMQQITIIKGFKVTNKTKHLDIMTLMLLKS